MKLSNKVYDILKAIALIWLPAIGTLYFALAGIWNLPYPEEIVGTITAVGHILGKLQQTVAPGRDSLSIAPASAGANLV